MEKITKILWVLLIGVLSFQTGYSQDGNTGDVKKEKGEEDLGSFALEVKKEEALRFYNKAEKFRKYKNYNQALIEYDKAMAINKNNHRFLYGKALSLYSLKDTTDQAKKLLEDITYIKDNFVMGYVLMAKILKKEHDYPGAAESYRKAATYSKDTTRKVKYYLNSMKYLIKAEDFQGVEMVGQEIKPYAPNNVSVMQMTAKAANADGHYEKAIDLMGIAVKKAHPTDERLLAQLYYEMGYAYYMKQDYSMSDKAWAKAKVGRYKGMIYKLSPEYFYKVSKTYFLALDYEKSSEYLEKVLGIKKDFTEAYKLKAELAKKQKDNTSSAGHYKEGLDATSDPVKKMKLYSSIINIYLDAANYAEAINLSTECLKSNPKAYDIKFLKAMAFSKSGQAEDAIRLLESLSKTPGIAANNIVKYNFCLGRLYKEQGMLEKAEVAFKASTRGAFMHAAKLEYGEVKKELVLSKKK